MPVFARMLTDEHCWLRERRVGCLELQASSTEGVSQVKRLNYYRGAASSSWNVLHTLDSASVQALTAGNAGERHTL